MATRKSAVLDAILALCAAAALVAAGWLWRANQRGAAEVERLAKGNRELSAELEALRRAREAAPAPEPAPPEIDRRPLPTPAAPPAGLDAAGWRVKLAEANGAIADLEQRLQDLRLEVHRLTVDNKRLAASEADLNENLASANRLIEAQQRELKSRSDRAVQLEIANQQLRSRNAAETAKAREMMNLARELQEIHSRREGLLASILRRYREVADEYRSLAGVMERRTQEDAPPLAGADVSRIKNAISLAEEDLQQLGLLNAQALRVQKKITAQ